MFLQRNLISKIENLEHLAKTLVFIELSDNLVFLLIHLLFFIYIKLDFFFFFFRLKK